MEMFGYRKILPLENRKGVVTIPGPMPEIIYVRPDQLVINEDYQRELSEAAKKHILSLATNWDWGSFTALSIAKTEVENIYEVVDGQRTAIAAMTNGNIELLPALLSSADTLQRKAKDFVGINTSRVPLTRFAIYNAELAAQDETCIEVECALSETNCKLLGVPPMKNIFKPGDTMAISTLKSIVINKGQARLKRLLNIARQGNAAPVTSNLIKALDLCIPTTLSDSLDKNCISIFLNVGAMRFEMLAKNKTPPGRRTYETLADLIGARLELPSYRLGFVTTSKRVKKS